MKAPTLRARQRPPYRPWTPPPVSPSNKLLMVALAFTMGRRTNDDLMRLRRVTEKARPVTGTPSFRRVREACEDILAHGLTEERCKALIVALETRDETSVSETPTDDVPKPHLWWKNLDSME